MTFRNRMNEPKRLVPIATMCLVMGILLPMFFHPETQLVKNLSHAVAGMLLGFSIAVNLGAAWKMRRRQRCAGKETSQ